MVKRYAAFDGKYLEGGMFVLHTDYEKLEKENARLREALDDLRNLYTCTAGNAHGCQGHELHSKIDKALVKP